MIFRRIEDIEAEAELILLLNDLKPELPFEKIAALDRLEHVSTVEVRVFAGNLLSFVPPQ